MVPRLFAAAQAMRSRTCADVIQPCCLTVVYFFLLFFVTARPWAERVSWFTRGLFFLTARPWAERVSWFTHGLFFFNRAAMGRARFMFYPWFHEGFCSWAIVV